MGFLGYNFDASQSSMSAEGYTQRIRPEKTGPHNPLVLFDHSATLRLLRLGATQQASLRETQKDS